MIVSNNTKFEGCICIEDFKHFSETDLESLAKSILNAAQTNLSTRKLQMTFVSVDLESRFGISQSVSINPLKTAFSSINPNFNVVKKIKDLLQNRQKDL